MPMRYSLLNRFQGGLLGSLIGEALSGYDHDDLRGEECSALEQKLSVRSSVSMGMSEHLIRYGRLFQNDWHDIYQQPENALDWRTTVNNSEIALATLPLSLFFHDNRSLFREQLQELSLIAQVSSEALEDTLVWGYAIALALRKEKLIASQFMAHLLEYCHKFQTPLRQKLEQIQTFLEQGSTLEQVVAQCRQSQSNQKAIALALYCFADTPEDLRLCVLRARRTGAQAQTTAALTGALAGVYNSFSGFPLPWRLALQKWEIGQKMYQQAIHLFAAWSGVYDLNQLESLQSAAVASPLMIQLRPSLKIISQQEL